MSRGHVCEGALHTRAPPCASMRTSCLSDCARVRVCGGGANVRALQGAKAAVTSCCEGSLLDGWMVGRGAGGAGRGLWTEDAHCGPGTEGQRTEAGCTACRAGRAIHVCGRGIPRVYVCVVMRQGSTWLSVPQPWDLGSKWTCFVCCVYTQYTCKQGCWFRFVFSFDP